jgi:glucose/arabinose dehydrogenase
VRRRFVHWSLAQSVRLTRVTVASQPAVRRALAGGALVATLVLLLPGCNKPASQPSPDTQTAGTQAPTGGSQRTPSGQATTSGSQITAKLQVSEVLTGLTTPWGLVALSDGSLLISERDTGKILHLQGSKTTVVQTINEVDPGGEAGLLGLLASKDEGRVFAFYTASDDNRIVSMSWDGQRLGEPKVILSGIPKGGRHFGGRMVLGPDGYIYVGAGEGGDSDLAQDKGSLGGKILRITLDGKPAPGNPFGNEIYSYGHRNIEGLAFDNQGRLWASEFGEQDWDELNLITKGGNYGWPLVEGSGSGKGLINPKIVWRPGDASPSGLAYWQGELWMAALRGGRLWEIPLDGASTGKPIAHFTDAYGRLRSVIVAHDGNSLLFSSSNTDGRGDPGPGDDKLYRMTR